MNPVIVLLVCILFAALYILQRSNNSSLKKPPLVKYTFPIIGHTYEYLFNTSELFQRCRKEYGEIFSLYIWGRVETYVGKEHCYEILTKDDTFNFEKSLDLTFPASDIFRHATNMRPLKDYVLSKLEFYNERVQKKINFATQRYIGDCEEPRVIYNTFQMFTKIISVPIASIFIGEEEAEYDEVIATFSDYTKDVSRFFVILPFLDFIYPGLHVQFCRFLLITGLFNPTTKHRNVLVSHIKRQIGKRLLEKQKYGDLWKRPSDLLQDLIDEEDFVHSEKSYEYVADLICNYIFASIFTTSTGCADAVMALASRPEYMQELYEEQVEIRTDYTNENGILSFEALDKMEKLDSFVKESFRLAGNLVSLTHTALKDHTFSNSDLQIQKGQRVAVYTHDVYSDELSQGSDPESFRGFRHMNKNSSAAKLSKNFLTFGGGKHACPGRFLAVREIKFFMHNAILKYKFRTVSGKVEEKLRLGPNAMPSPAGILFEKRIK